MLVDLGYALRKEDQQNTFTVSANIYSEEVGDYVKHWDGGTFDNYQDAFDFWDVWQPPKNEIDNEMVRRRELGDYSHHELEVGIWCNDLDVDLPFMNMTLDAEHEKS